MKGSRPDAALTPLAVTHAAAMHVKLTSVPFAFDLVTVPVDMRSGSSGSNNLVVVLLLTRPRRLGLGAAASLGAKAVDASGAAIDAELLLH